MSPQPPPYLYVDLQVLHPKLDDKTDKKKLWKDNNNIGKHVARLYNRPWDGTLHHPDPEQGMDEAYIRFTYLDVDPEDDEAPKKIKELCDDLFNENGEKALKHFEHAEEILFAPISLHRPSSDESRPTQPTSNQSSSDNTGDIRDANQQQFGRCFVMGMAKAAIKPPTFVDVSSGCYNIFSRNNTRWILVEAVRATVCLADCLELFGGFIKLLAPLTTDSTRPSSIKFVQGNSPSERERQIRDMETVLRILKSGSMIGEWLQNVGLLRLCNASGALDNAVLEAAQTVEQATTQLTSRLNDLIAGCGHDTIPRDAIRPVLTELKSCLEEVGQLSKLTNERVHMKKGAATLWSCLTVVLAVGAILAFNVAAPVALTSTLFSMGGLGITGIGFIKGTVVVATAGSGIFTVVRRAQWHNSKEAEKLTNKIAKTLHSMWLFVTLMHLRQEKEIKNSDERLVEFAKRVAVEFGGIDVMNDWFKPDYCRKFIGQDLKILSDDMRKLRENLR